MNKNLFVLALCTILVSACTTPPANVSPAASAAATAGGLIPVNVCYSAPTTTQAVPWYGMENGIFEKYGLKVNLIRVQASSQAVTTLISGDTSLCEAAGNSVINAVAAGQDVVMVAGIYNTYPAVLVARPDIKSVADLKGKRVGTGLNASASDVATRLVLMKLGLDPERDVELVQIGEEPDRFAAFQAGRIDAALATSPYLHRLRESGVSELFDFSKVDLPYSHTSILTTRKFVAQDRPVVLSFLKAIVESIARMKADPEGTKKVLAKYQSLDPVANAADLNDAYANIVLPFVQDVPYPSLEGLQTLITYTVASNPQAANLKPEQLVDMSLLKELEDSGFIAGFVHK
jgi:NitT/TauT family transport system substrate-binding protein